MNRERVRPAGENVTNDVWKVKRGKSELDLALNLREITSRELLTQEVKSVSESSRLQNQSQHCL